MSQTPAKGKKKQDKSRTPSGTEIQNTVSGIRSFFSPEAQSFEVIEENLLGTNRASNEHAHNKATLTL